LYKTVAGAETPIKGTALTHLGKSLIGETDSVARARSAGLARWSDSGEQIGYSRDGLLGLPRYHQREGIKF